MPLVPLGNEAYSRLRGVTPEVVLKNFYLEEDKSGASPDTVARLQRSGLTGLVTFPATIRGIFQLDGVFNGVTFVVAGDKLYSTDLANKTLIGTIPNDNLPVRLAANDFKLGIVTAGQFWTYDGSDLAHVELPDDEECNGIETIYQYFILTLATGRIRWLRPEADDFSDPDDVLAYATAEGLPDGLLGVARLRDELFMFGTASIEVWQFTGNSDSAFERAPGRSIDRGVQSFDSVSLFDNSLMFVGDDGVVYRVADVPQRISTHGIEERIESKTDLCTSFTFTSQGHKFYCLRVPGEGTFAFDAATGVWSEFATQGQTTWVVRYALDTSFGALAADASGKLYRIDPDATTDDGTPIERVITGTIALPPMRIANHHLAIYLGCEESAPITLRWRDGRDTEWSDARTLTARAGYDIVHAWRLGATRGAFRTFEIATSADTNVRISAALANEGRVS